MSVSHLLRICKSMCHSAPKNWPATPSHSLAQRTSQVFSFAFKQSEEKSVSWRLPPQESKKFSKPPSKLLSFDEFVERKVESFEEFKANCSEPFASPEEANTAYNSFCQSLYNTYKYEITVSKRPPCFMM